MTTDTLSGQSTMAEVLEAYPGAQRSLMRGYHIGGCSSCGFDPSDRLSDVLQRHNAPDAAEVLTHLRESQEQEERMQIEPVDLAERLKGEGPPRLIDVRDQREFDIVHLEGAQLATQEFMQEMLSTWPKDTACVTDCHSGMRSLDAASYLIGHGFTNVQSLRGGIDAWAQTVDTSMPRY